MRLSEFSLEHLRQALDIYLAHAYPSGIIPPDVRARLEFRGRDLAEILSQSQFQKVFSESLPNRIDRYLLRLGNWRYPHMKFGLVRCGDGDDFVFAVDTHDAHIASSPVVKNSPEFKRIVALNRSIREQIEAQWREAGLPCFTDTLRIYKSSSSSRSAKTILLVDDERDIVELIKTLLEKEGYRVICASDGLDALVKAERAEVDLCLLDIMMPDVDGLDIARALREKADFPIIFISALQAGVISLELADGYIGKPFTPDRLLAEVRSRVG